MELVNIPGFGPGSLENDIYTFDALPNTRFKRVGEAFQPILHDFYVGQEVWCELLSQKGKIVGIRNTWENWPVEVSFECGTNTYSLKGELFTHYRPTLRPLQKFNVGQRVVDGNGKTGVVISNTFHGEYTVLVQWDVANPSYLNQLDGYTSLGLFDCDIVINDKNISHA